MRLLSVNPPISGFHHDVPPILPPLGIMYAASMAQRRGHDVSIFDFLIQGTDNFPKSAPPRIFM